MNVQRVLHRVEGAAVVDDADLHHVPDREVPLDLVVLVPGCGLAQHPANLASGRGPVHARHRPGPLDRIEVDPVVGHRSFDGGRQILGLQRHHEFTVGLVVEAWPVAVDIRDHVGVLAQRLERGPVVVGCGL